MSDQELNDRENQVAQMLRAAAESERAPASLRSEIDALRRESARRRLRRQPMWVPRVALRYGSAAATAVAAVVVALVLALGGAGAPSIAQAAALALRPPTAPAPAPDSQAPQRLLSARVGDLHFPNWTAPQGWRSSGQRSDRIDGRDVTTVYYTNGSQTIAYSIVAAPALTGLNTHGEAYATMRQHGRTVVVWQERNHTCVLSSVSVPTQGLWRLAVSTLY
jgi:hypothetical protein